MDKKYVIIEDTSIVAINIGKKEHRSGNIIYKDKQGVFHTIDFASCSLNFNEQDKNSSGFCVGERNIIDGYFIFYTSGIKTKVLFQKGYVLSNIFTHKPLTGTKNKRFRALNVFINSSGFTTYDLS